MAIDPAKAKELLGEDFEAFQEFKAQKDKKVRAQAARDHAKALVGENGKYYEQYSRLETQLDAIWNKALLEGKQAQGLVDESGAEIEAPRPVEASTE